MTALGLVCKNDNSVHLHMSLEMSFSFFMSEGGDDFFFLTTMSDQIMRVLIV